MPDIPTQTCIVTDGAGTISGSNVSDITVSCRNVLVSANRAGIEGSGTSWGLSVNSDGQYVAFSSSANNLVDGDINNNHDIFVKNTASGVISLVSVDDSGIQGDNNKPLNQR